MDDITIVADVLARFRGDFSDLNAGSTQANQNLTQMADPAKDVHTHLTNAGQAADQFSGHLGESLGVLGEIEEKSKSVSAAIKGIAFGAVGGAGLGGLLDSAIATTSELQTLKVQFDSTFGPDSQAQLNQTVKFANDMGVSIGSAATSYQTFALATKGNVENMKKDQKDFADIAAGTGSSIDTISSSISNYFQLVQRLGGSGGSASRYATTLLEQHIIDPTTYNQLRVQANQGATPNDLLNLILKDAEEQYGGAGAKEADTLSGRLQTFKNLFSEGTSSAFSPVTSGISGLLGDANKDLQSTGFKQAEADIGSFITVIGKGAAMLLPFVKGLTDMGLAFAGLIAHLGPLREGVELAVAAFLAFEAVKIGTSLTEWVAGLARGQTSAMTTRAATIDLTAAIQAQTDALAANAEAMAAAVGIRSTAATAMLAKASMVPIETTSSVVGSADVAGVAGASTITGAMTTGAFIGSSNSAITGSAGAVSDVVAGGAANVGLSDVPAIVGTGTLLGGGGLLRDTGGALGDTFAGMSPLMRGGLIGAGGYIGANLIGDAVGGRGGADIKTVGDDTAIGAGIGTAVGLPFVGAGLGAVVGLIQMHFNNAAQAAAEFASTVNSAVQKQQAGAQTLYSGATLKPDTTLGNISSDLAEAHKNLTEANAAISHATVYRNEPVATRAGMAEDHVRVGAPDTHLREVQTTAQRDFNIARGNEFNATQNAAYIEKFTGINANQVAGFASSADISLTSNLNSNLSNLTTAIENFKTSGGLLQYNAEQYSNKLGYISSEAGGTSGQTTFNLDAALKEQNTSWKQFSAYLTATGQNTPTQYAPQGAAAALGVTAASASKDQLTPQFAQELIQQTSAAQGLRDAQLGVQEASWGLVQAEFGVAQAAFAASQSYFQLSEAEFQASRATFQQSVNLTTQAASFNAVNSALNNGYLPANYNIAATLQQTTSLTAAQTSAIMQEVTAYNAVEAAMYGVNASGQSLYSTYTQLSGNVQVIQAQMQGYQNILGQTLQGQQQFNAIQESQKMQAAGTSMQEAQLQLEGYSTSSPQYINAQRQAAIEQAQSTITQDQNTLGLGNEQYQISQAQMPPPQSFQAMLTAAQGVGALQGPLLAAQQALAAIAPQYDATNTALQIQTQRNQAVTQAVQQQASADQAAITGADSVRTATNGVATALNNVVVAENGVITAGQGVITAKNNIADAAASMSSATLTAQANVTSNMQTMASNVANYVQNIGFSFATLGHTMGNVIALLGAESYASGMALSAKNPTYQKSWTNAANDFSNDIPNADLITNVQSLISSLNALGAAGVPRFAEGGMVPGSGPLLAVVHGGEGVLTPTQMQSLRSALNTVGITVGGANTTGTMAAAGGSGTAITIGSGAVQVRVEVQGSMLGTAGQLQAEVAQTVNEAITQLMTQLQGS